MDDNPITTELDGSVALLQGAVAELGNFKVLGVVGSVLLVVDVTTDGSFVVKVGANYYTENIL